MIFLVWTADARPEGDLGPGPWSDTVPLAPGLWYVASEQSRSRVYHAVKEAIAPDSALLVSQIDDPPKAKGLAPGATTWFEAHR